MLLYENKKFGFYFVFCSIGTIFEAERKKEKYGSNYF